MKKNCSFKFFKFSLLLETLKLKDNFVFPLILWYQDFGSFLQKLSEFSWASNMCFSPSEWIIIKFLFLKNPSHQYKRGERVSHLQSPKRITIVLGGGSHHIYVY
jgi:hypothetical protein